MLRKAFIQEIDNTKDEIFILGSLVEQAIYTSVDALKAHSMDTSQQVIENDAVINAKRFEIAGQVLNIIAMQQPMAHDLRVLASILEITSELERIGDYAKGIAMLCIRIGSQPVIKHLTDLTMMAELSMNMLHRSLVAFADEDADTARKIPDEDDQVDNLYVQFYRVTLTYFIENPSSIDEVNYLMWAAHNLERAADRVSNICERTIFVATGEITELTRYAPQESSVQ
jgi:phosphate transport system protein